MTSPTTAQPAPANAGPAVAPPAAGTLPASPAVETSSTPVPPPLTTATLAAAIGRQLSGEKYDLNPSTTTPAAVPGQEPLPEEPAAVTAAQDQGTEPTEDIEAEAGGQNPAFARLRIEAKEAKAKLKEITAELDKLKSDKSDKPETIDRPDKSDSTLSMPEMPELRQAQEAEATQSQVVQWARRAVTRLERAQSSGQEDDVLATLRQEMGAQATVLPQTPAAALEWLDNLHAHAQDLLQGARVQKEVLSRQIKEAARDVQEQSRQFAETVMPSIFKEDSPEARMVNDARQLFPGIEKNPLFYTWVVKAIKGHQAIEAEAAAKAEGNGNSHGTNRLKTPLRPVQIPGARPGAKLPGASSQLPARPSESVVNGSSHWMAQMRAAKTAAERENAKVEWHKALAQEIAGSAVERQ